MPQIITLKENCKKGLHSLNNKTRLYKLQHTHKLEAEVIPCYWKNTLSCLLLVIKVLTQDRFSAIP